MLKEAAVARAAATGATAEDALDCLLTVLPQQGGTPVSQVGSLISTVRPGGWAENFSHLGGLAAFIEANPYYLQLEHTPTQAIVTRCDPESAAANGAGAAALAEQLTDEQAADIVVSLVPPGQAMPISMLGSLLGGGGFNRNKAFSHLAKNFQTFLLNHPERFLVDGPSNTVQLVGAMVAVAAPLQTYARPTQPVEGRATPQDAAAALLAALPEGPLPLAQLGSLLGQGGWKASFGHLGTLVSFIQANPQLFTVDDSAAALGKQFLVMRGPFGLEQVAEVNPGTPPPSKLRRREEAGPGENGQPAKRQAVGVPVATIRTPALLLRPPRLVRGPMRGPMRGRRGYLVPRLPGR